METFTDQDFAPGMYTQPLSQDFDSDGPKLIRFVEKYYKTPDGKPLVLDQWQKALLNHILEKKDEELRYRQVVVSMGRQNGKSVLAAVLSLYGLFQHVKGPQIIGVASSRLQAQIVYDRTYYVVKNNKVLDDKVKATGTRGLRFRDGGGEYQMKASKGDSLQGLPITLGLADELHIMKEEVWDAIVVGQRAQKNALLIGITTAGDDDSKLLQRLYNDGERAINGLNPRFGFFCWSAPEGSSIKDDEALMAANPSIRCGRVDLETVRNDVMTQPVADQERYTLNRFVAAIQGWLPVGDWINLGHTNEIKPKDPNLVFSVDMHGSYDFATISAHKKTDDNFVHSQMIATMVSPTYQALKARVMRLWAKHPNCTFVLDSKMLGALGKELKDSKVNVRILHATEIQEACSTAYALIVQRRIKHDHQNLMTYQVPRGRRKNTGDQWAISRKMSSSEVDCLLSYVMGIYIAETQKPKTGQLFI